MALSPKQQQQYNQLISAGASQQAAMQAAQLVPDTSTENAPPSQTVQGGVLSAQGSTPQQQTSPNTTLYSAQGIPSIVDPSQVSINTYNASNPNGLYATDPTKVAQTLGIQPGVNGAPNVPSMMGGVGGIDKNVMPDSGSAPSQAEIAAQQQQGYMASMGYTPPQIQGVVQQQQQAQQQNQPQPSADQMGSKYQAAFNAVQGSPVPASGGVAGSQIQGAVTAQTSTDPVMSAAAGQMPTIQSALAQVLSNINNPLLTAMSLQNEYNQLQQKFNLPVLQAEAMNIQNLMNGTEDDVRDEITKAGGFATESQIMGITAARNKVWIKQYNTLATQIANAQNNIQAQMQYASEDQRNALTRQSNMTSILEYVATMSVNMQKFNSDNLNKIVTNVGYQGLAAQAAGNPQMLAYYESSLGLAPGSLSDPSTLNQLETLRQKTVSQGQQRIVIQSYNAGLGVGGTQAPIVPNPVEGSPSITKPYTQDQLVRPTWLDSKVPLSMTQGQMDQYSAASGATKDKGTNNIIAPGIGYYVQQADGSYVLNSAIPQQTATKSVDSQYNDMVSQMQKAQQTPVGGSPLNKGRLSRNANTALKNYTSSTIYQQVSNATSYLSRVKAAMQNPGSISDTELADAIIKINTGGGQVTEAQINTYFQGQSFKDKFAVLGDKITAKGGVLSPQQRQDLAALAQETFTNYETMYEQLYVQAGQNLQGQGIPLNYLSNIPDFTQLLQGQAANVQ